MTIKPFAQKPTRIFEMLDLVQSQPTEQDKIDALKWVQCTELNTVLLINFTDRVKLDLPPGPITFEHDNGDPDNSLCRTSSIIPELCELYKQNHLLNQDQKVHKFVGILESVNVREAEVFLLLKDKALGKLWNCLTADLVRKAIPNLL